MTLASDQRLAEHYRRQLASVENRLRRMARTGKEVAAPRSGDDWQRRRVWRHNSFLGHCAMAEKNLLAIIEADSTTTVSKNLATQTWQMVRQLAESLKERIDP